MSKARIAVLIDTATGWGRRVIQGIVDYNLQHGAWDLFVEAKGQDENFQIPDGLGYQGMIARVSSEAMVEDLHRRNIPVINVSALSIPGADFPRVATDYSTSAKLAINHFKERALINFAYVGPLHLAHVREHEQAFESTLAASGTTCSVFNASEELVQSIPNHIRNEELIPWLKELPKPVGIFTWGFQIGRDIISACHEADIAVPDDIAILGGDYDELLSDVCHPPLSGIVTPARKVGYQAASILHDMLNGEAPPEKTIFLQAGEIEARQSTEIMAIDDPYVQQALKFLEENACSNIQVEDILKQVPVARRLLERRFMKLLGRSPAQEIRRIRINHARKLLATTNLSTDRIAEACGYSTYNYLGSVFKKETGMSPGQYRKQIRGGS